MRPGSRWKPGVLLARPVLCWSGANTAVTCSWGVAGAVVGDAAGVASMVAGAAVCIIDCGAAGAAGASVVLAWLCASAITTAVSFCVADSNRDVEALVLVVPGTGVSKADTAAATWVAAVVVCASTSCGNTASSVVGFARPRWHVTH